MKAPATYQSKSKFLAIVDNARTVRSELVVLGLVMAVMGVASGFAVAEEEQDPRLPKTPTAFETRNLSKNSESVATVRKVDGKTKKVRVVAVTQSREWKDSGGKVIMARLLAFDPVKKEEALLIRNGKVRLLVDGAKSFNLLPLTKLGVEDQAYIKGLAAARKKEAQARKASE